MVSRRKSIELARLSARGSSGRRASAEAPSDSLAGAVMASEEEDPDSVALPPAGANFGANFGANDGVNAAPSCELQAVVVHAGHEPAVAGEGAAKGVACGCLRRRGAGSAAAGGADARAVAAVAEAAPKVPFSRLLALNKPEWWAGRDGRLPEGFPAASLRLSAGLHEHRASNGTTHDPFERGGRAPAGKRQPAAACVRASAARHFVDGSLID